MKKIMLLCLLMSGCAAQQAPEQFTLTKPDGTKEQVSVGAVTKSVVDTLGILGKCIEDAKGDFKKVSPCLHKAEPK